MGQAAVGSDGVCDRQESGDGEGNEDILYECRHFYKMKSGQLINNQDN